MTLKTQECVGVFCWIAGSRTDFDRAGLSCPQATSFFSSLSANLPGLSADSSGTSTGNSLKPSKLRTVCYPYLQSRRQSSPQEHNCSYQAVVGYEGIVDKSQQPGLKEAWIYSLKYAAHENGNGKVNGTELVRKTHLVLT